MASAPKWMDGAGAVQAAKIGVRGLVGGEE
jgi:hypothetical protein